MFKSNIKSIMEEKGLTTRGVSEQAGISKQTLLKARQDEGISECRLSTLGRIANALGIPVKETFDGEQDGPAEKE